MTEPEYDDTDMTPEEFERKIAAGIPADISPAKPAAEFRSLPIGVIVELSSNSADGTANLMAVRVGGQLAQVAAVSERGSAHSAG